MRGILTRARMIRYGTRIAVPGPKDHEQEMRLREYTRAVESQPRSDCIHDGQSGAECRQSETGAKVDWPNFYVDGLPDHTLNSGELAVLWEIVSIVLTPFTVYCIWINRTLSTGDLSFDVVHSDICLGHNFRVLSVNCHCQPRPAVDVEHAMMFASKLHRLHYI